MWEIRRRSSEKEEQRKSNDASISSLPSFFPTVTAACIKRKGTGGASVRGKQELSVCGNGKIFCMWKKADLCTTWKVIFCHYVKNPYVLTTWKIGRARLMRL